MIWTNLKLHYARKLPCKFELSWSSGSWKDFKMIPSYFCNYLPFEEDLPLHLNKLEFPSPKDDLYQVWLKLAQWFWRRRFLKNFSVFLLFRYYLPLEKGVALHLNKLESPCPKDDLCQVWLKLAQWFWRSQKCESLQTDRKTDGQRAIRKAHLSFQSRWAKNAKTIT